jgi:hypothetical protein
MTRREERWEWEDYGGVLDLAAKLPSYSSPRMYLVDQFADLGYCSKGEMLRTYFEKLTPTLA